MFINKPYNDNMIMFLAGSIKKKVACATFFELMFILFFFKLLFGNSAYRACPVFRNILPFCAGIYTVIRIAILFIINITAYHANIFFHGNNLLHNYIYDYTLFYGSFPQSVQIAVFTHLEHRLVHLKKGDGLLAGF